MSLFHNTKSQNGVENSHFSQTPYAACIQSCPCIAIHMALCVYTVYFHMALRATEGDMRFWCTLYYTLSLFVDMGCELIYTQSRNVAKKCSHLTRHTAAIDRCAVFSTLLHYPLAWQMVQGLCSFYICVMTRLYQTP